MFFIGIPDRLMDHDRRTLNFPEIHYSLNLLELQFNKFHFVTPIQIQIQHPVKCSQFNKNSHQVSKFLDP